MTYRLQNLLEVRARSEEETARTLAEAIANHAREQAAQQRLRDQATTARGRLERERRLRAEEAPETGAAAARTTAYLAGLADDVRRMDREAASHRDGPLARTRAAEETARTHHTEARREREIVSRHKDGVQAAERIAQDRRAEDAASDLAVAALHHRRP